MQYWSREKGRKTGGSGEDGDRAAARAGDQQHRLEP